MKLTTATVRTLAVPDGKSEAIFFDDDLPGFGLRLREKGSRSFVFQYKLGGKQRRMGLGIANPATVAEARKSAIKLYARVKLGQDPASEKAEAKQRVAETFGAGAAEYLATLSHYRPRSLKTATRYLMKHAKPLHGTPLAKITRRDVATLLTSLNKNGPVAANRARTALNAFFAWTIQQGLLELNPVTGTKVNEEESRDRVLTPSELRQIWHVADGDYGAIIKLLALTGQRIGEIAGLRWSEIQDGAIVLPAERTKNGRPHVVPLSPLALQIIEAQERREGRDFIFGRDGATGFVGLQRAKVRLDKRIAAAGKPINDWVPHDLRRSFATYAQGGLPPHLTQGLSVLEKELATGLEVEPHVIEAVLNHVSGTRAGVAGIYNRSTYEPQKRAALDRWAERLLAIVEDRPSNVTPLRTANRA
jgi:integrase